MGAKLRNFIALCYNRKSVFVHKNVRKDAKKGVRCWGNGFFYYICNDTLQRVSIGDVGLSDVRQRICVKFAP